MQRIILVSKLSPQEVEGVLFDLIEGFSTKVSTNIREGESHFDVKKKKFNTGWRAAMDQTFESSITWRYIYFISIS
jgi:endo-alpha-1,4-polygalactosaminidase (GH114 family)